MPTTLPTVHDTCLSCSDALGLDSYQVVRKLVAIVLRSRFGSSQCEMHAANSPLCYVVDDKSKASVKQKQQQQHAHAKEQSWTLRIVQPASKKLVEEWTLTLEHGLPPKTPHQPPLPRPTSDNSTSNTIGIQRLMQVLYSHAKRRHSRAAPHENRDSLRFAVHHNLVGVVCTGCSAHGDDSDDEKQKKQQQTWEIFDFPLGARLFHHAFPVATACDGVMRLLVHVQAIDHDETPPIAAPRRSSISNTSRNAGNPMNSSTIAPWTATSPSSSVIGMRRLSRLSLSAMDLDDDANGALLLPQQDTYDTLALSPTMLRRGSMDAVQYTRPGRAFYYVANTNSHGMDQLASSSWQPAPPPSILPSSPPGTTSNGSSSPLGIRQRRRSSSHHLGLVGSYEESLLTGHMWPLQPSQPFEFSGKLGVLGRGHDCPIHLKCPQQIKLSFNAIYYQDNTLASESSSPSPSSSSYQPYVGTIDLPGRGYRVPAQGQVQLAVYNQNNVLIKLFLVPYDVRDMPPGHKTFLRQKSYEMHRAPAASVGKAAGSQATTVSNCSPAVATGPLRYAVHLQLRRSSKPGKVKVYLYHQMRVIFVNRRMDASESYHVVCEGPKEPAYVPLK
ncbi:hypothetical protein BC940DRAFT_26470 [Gongronella butleri]|nr:hypothetical protein BC940DRAFT_26470 [Gongronella butleri]